LTNIGVKQPCSARVRVAGRSEPRCESSEQPRCESSEQPRCERLVLSKVLTGTFVFVFVEHDHTGATLDDYPLLFLSLVPMRPGVVGRE